MGKKILLADDSLTIQKVVQITFARQDAELTTVDNGDDALELVQQKPFDVVLADVMMPGKDGYALTQAIKQNPQTANVPVLLLAGSYEPFDEAKARAAGADDFILKPFESQSLIAKVDEVMSGVGAATPAPAPAATAKPPASAAPQAAAMRTPRAPAPEPRRPVPPAPATTAPKPKPPAPAPAAPPPAPPSAPAEADMWDLSEEEPAAPARRPAAPQPGAPQPVTPAGVMAGIEAAGEEEVDVDLWDLSEEAPAAPAAPLQAAAPNAPPGTAPMPAAEEPEIEVAADAWDLSEEEPAAAAQAQPAPAGPGPVAPPPTPAPPPPTVEADAWDLTEEPTPPSPSEMSARRVEQSFEVEEPVFGRSAEAEQYGEVEIAGGEALEGNLEVEVDTGEEEGDIWDISEEEPLELATEPKAEAEPWDMTEEPEPAPQPTAAPTPVTEPPPLPKPQIPQAQAVPPAPPPPATPSQPAAAKFEGVPTAAAPKAPKAAPAGEAQVDTEALRRAMHSIIERELPRMMSELLGVVADEVRKSVPGIAERVIAQEIEKIKGAG